MKNILIVYDKRWTSKVSMMAFGEGLQKRGFYPFLMPVLQQPRPIEVYALDHLDDIEMEEVRRLAEAPK